MKIFNFTNQAKKDFLLALENLINEDKFFDVPMGGTLASVYYLQFYYHHWRVSDSILDFLRYIKYRFFTQRIQLNHNAFIEIDTKIIMTLVGDRKELIDLVRPLTETFNKEEIVLLLGEDKYANYFNDEIKSISWNDIYFNFDKRWSEEYRKVSKIWFRKILKFLIQKKASPLLFWTIAFHLLIQSNRVYVLRDLLSINKPKLILTEFDRNFLASPLVLAARVNKIKTITMVHGVINPPYSGYLPLLADYIFCWGEQQKELLISEGVDPKKIVITGNQRFIEYKNEVYSNKCFKKKASQNLTITLGTAPIFKEDRRKIAIEFCESIKLMSETIAIKGIVRLHPSEKLAFYEKIQKAYPKIHFSSNNEYSMNEILEMSDIVVVNDSGFGNDAILNNKIVVVFNPTSTEPGNGKLLNIQANCPLANTPDEFVKTIHKLLTDDEYYQKIIKDLMAYQDHFCFAYSQDASKNVVNEVQRILSLEIMGSSTNTRR